MKPRSPQTYIQPHEVPRLTFNPKQTIHQSAGSVQTSDAKRRQNRVLFERDFNHLPPRARSREPACLPRRCLPRPLCPFGRLILLEALTVIVRRTRLAPEIHQWIRPASLKQRTVSFSREGKDEQPLLPSITGGTLCASNGPLQNPQSEALLRYALLNKRTNQKR